MDFDIFVVWYEMSFQIEPSFVTLPLSIRAAVYQGYYNDWLWAECLWSLKNII